MRARTLAASLAVVAAASAACGKTQEEKRVDTVRSICNSLVPGTTDYRDAVKALEGGEFQSGMQCGAPLTAEGAGDVCDYGASVCQQDLIYVARDDRTCTTGAGGGCIYGCVLRFAQADLDANGQNAKLCARFFYGPQTCSAVTPVVC